MPLNVSANVLILSSLLGTALGLWLLWEGWWPARVGAIPHCRRCDYDLRSTHGPICPECGLELTGNRELGERDRRPALTAVGLLLVLAGLAPVIWTGVRFAQTANWSRLTPTQWLVTDLESSNSPSAPASWRELRQRDPLGKLDSETVRRIADCCLKSQAAPVRETAIAEKLDYLGRCLEDGRLSPAQQGRLFRNLLQSPSLSLPQRMLQGRSFLCGTLMDTRIPKPIEVRLCHARVQHAESGEVLWASPEVWFTLSGEADQPSSRPMIHGLQAGQLPLVLQTTVEVRDRKTGDLHHSYPLSLKGQVEVVTMDSLNIAVRIDAAMGQSLSRQVRLLYPTLSEGPWSSGDQVVVARGMHSLTYWYEHDALPAAVAMDVFARVDGREFPIGSISTCESRTCDRSMVRGSYFGPVAEKMDLILRSSPALTEELVASSLRTGALPRQIWQGEIIYPDVPVRIVESQTPAAP